MTVITTVINIWSPVESEQTDFTFEHSGPGRSTVKPDVEDILSTDVVGHWPGFTLTEIHSKVHHLPSEVNTNG